MVILISVLVTPARLLRYYESIRAIKTTASLSISRRVSVDIISSEVKVLLLVSLVDYLFIFLLLIAFRYSEYTLSASL